MDSQGISYKSGLAACVAAWLLALGAQAASSTEPPYCAATESYLQKRQALGQKAYTVDEDFSCLTDLATLSKDLSSYQLVDTRHSLAPGEALTGAWLMSVRDLIATRALRNKPLLLLGEGFSRVAAAQDCAALKRAGYRNLRILVGGVPTWRLKHQKRFKNTLSGIKTVSARQVLYEYFNGEIVLVAATEQIAHELEAMGLGGGSYTLGLGQPSLKEIIADRSGGGHYPVVYVGSPSSMPIATPESVDNLYRLEGSTGSIAHELVKNQWVNANRESVPRRYRCGQS